MRPLGTALCEPVYLRMLVTRRCTTDGDSDVRGQGLLAVLRCSSLVEDVRRQKYRQLHSPAVIQQHYRIFHHSEGAACVSPSRECRDVLVKG
jgi:hypothetical protein